VVRNNLLIQCQTDGKPDLIWQFGLVPGGLEAPSPTEHYNILMQIDWFEF
jgi:hypothetical protein